MLAMFMRKVFMVQERLPSIFIDIEQPGDRGSFHVRVIDENKRKVICENRLKEERSYFEYVYTARLLEGGSMGLTTRDEKLAEQQRHDRYQDLVRYGQRLYSELFGNNKRFKDYLAANAHLKNGAQLQLRLHDTASELWNIPWEYMHDGETFIAIDPRFPIVRNRINSGFKQEFKDIPHPLRVLVVISTPSDVSPLNVEAEIMMIRNIFKEAESTGRIQIDFIEDGRLESLEQALSSGDYHILHYSGHGAMSSLGSLLVLENEAGLSRPVYLNELLPIIQKAKNLRFVFLSACRTGNVRETEATSGIATGLLQSVPAVLAMQFSIRDDRATILSQAFYQSLSSGASLEEALHTSRQAMHQSNQALGDWGIPTLYLQKSNFRLVDPKIQVRGLSTQRRFDLSSLDTASFYVGRRREQRLIRAALENPKVAMSFVWGMAGFGKTALVRQILERPSRQAKIHAIQVFACDKLDANTLFSQFTACLNQYFPQLAKISDKVASYPQKAIQALSQHIKEKQLVLIFDRVDALMRPQRTRQWNFIDERLDSFFQALGQADWSIHCICISRFRWEKLNEISENSCLEVHLGSLIVSDASFLIHALPQLKIQDSEVLNRLFTLVGGHPQTLLFLNESLSKKPEAKLLANPKLAQLLAEFWKKRFLESVLRLLTSDEQAALRLLSIHHDVFNPQHVQLLVNLPEIANAEQLMIAWESLSLAHHIGLSDDGTTWYDIPPLIRSYITSQLQADEEKNLHFQVAEVLLESFVLSAHQRFSERNGPRPIDGDSMKTALEHIQFGLSGGRADIANRYLSLCYTWQDHYRKAQLFEVANTIALFLFPLLRNYQYNDLLRKLFEEVKAHATSSISLELHYWQALIALEDKKYSEAAKLLNQLEKATIGKVERQTLYAACLEAQGNLLRNQAQDIPAYKQYQAALTQYDALQDKPSMMRLRLFLSEHTFYKNNPKHASQNIEAALQIASSTERHQLNLRILAQLFIYRGHIQRDISADGEALKSYGQVLRLGRDLADSHLIARALENIGYTYGLLRQYPIAGQHLLQAMDIYEKANDLASLSLCLSRLAAIQYFQNNKTEALPLCERALRLAKEHVPANIAQTESLLKKIKNG